jgi:uncharacterized protein YggE
MTKLSSKPSAARGPRLASSLALVSAALFVSGAQAAPALALSGASAARSGGGGPAVTARTGPSGAVTAPPRAVRGEPAQITVVGRGNVRAAPDAMRLNVGVEVRRDRAAEAFAAVKQARARLAEALSGAGIALEDLRTDGLAFGAEYGDDARVTGYRASQAVEAVLRDLSRADAVVDAVAAVGEEARINGVSFEVSETGPLVEQARAAAYRDALAKARHFAALTGRRVGRVVRLEEEGDVPTPRFAMADSAFLSPGHGSVTAAVRVVYELV